VILLHSSGSSARQWDLLSEALQPHFQVHAIELHGHGAQPEWSSEAPLTLDEEARLVEPYLEESRGAHLVGHSYGGAVALRAASLHPRSVRSVIAYEPVLFQLLIDDAASLEEARDVLAIADSVRKRHAGGERELAAEAFVDFWSGAGSWQRLPESRKNAIATRMRSVMRHFDVLFRDPLPPARLARLTMPAMILTGERTIATTRRLGQLLRRVMPFARHETMAGMDHMGPITHAAEVNQRIVRFLRERVGLEKLEERVGGYA
jgi:pimeloyl-ACP methyl ester carboxylesterase